jgi:ribosomal protein S27AE
MSLSEKLKVAHGNVIGTREPREVIVSAALIQEAATILEAAEAWAKAKRDFMLPLNDGHGGSPREAAEEALDRADDVLLAALAAHGPSQETGTVMCGKCGSTQFEIVESAGLQAERCLQCGAEELLA